MTAMRSLIKFIWLFISLLLLTDSSAFAADFLSRSQTPAWERGKDGEILRRDSEGSSRGRSRSMMTRRSGELTRGLIRGNSQGKDLSASIPSSMVPLIPETSGLTSMPQPSLLWYVSGSWPDKMEFRINTFKADEPVLDTSIPGPSSEGIYRIDLAEYNISLKPDTEYEWFLTIVFEENDRSADYFISGTVIYSLLSDEVSERLANTPKDRLYAVYAEAGYWYDAIDHLSRQIDADPGDTALRKYRAKLLEHVNLPKIAAYDMRHVSGN
jgi:hypothetical protein